MYSKYIVPENYSGVRFKSPVIETETKLHKPTPSYTSTRTSVSPTFQNAINAQISKENSAKISRDVADFEEINDEIPEIENDFSQDEDFSKAREQENENPPLDITEEAIDNSSNERASSGKKEQE